MIRPKNVLIEFHTWDAGMSGITTYPGTITVDFGSEGKMVFHSVADIERGGKQLLWLYKEIKDMRIDGRNEENATT